jgi:hypothetical protein
MFHLGKRNRRYKQMIGGARSRNAGADRQWAIQPPEVTVDHRKRHGADDCARAISQPILDGETISCSRLLIFVFMPPPPSLPIDGDSLPPSILAGLPDALPVNHFELD